MSPEVPGGGRSGASPGASEEEKGDSGAGQSWHVILELAGAAAGIVGLLSLVGSAIMWARLHALDLPAARGVALLSNQFLLSLGASTLLVAMLVGVLAIGLFYGLRLALPEDVRHVAAYILVLALELVLLFAVFEVPLTTPQRLVVLVTGVLAGSLFAVAAANVHSFRRLGLAAFFLVATLGGVLSFARNLGAPVKLDPAIILLKDGSLTSGAYIATTADDVYLAPDLFNRTYGQLASIPRADVARISLSEPQDFRSAGAADSTPLFGGRATRSEQDVRSVEKYLAGRAGDPLWKYPPVSFLESQTYLRSHLPEFVRAQEQPWSSKGIKVALARLVADARTYSGQPVITTGRVRQIIKPPGQSGLTITQFLLVEEGRHGSARAICAVTTNRRFPVARRVEIRGVVVSAGTIAGSSETAKGVFMQCSAARNAPPRKGKGPIS